MVLCGPCFYKNKFLYSGRGHYTIDVIVAYFITSNTWWTYHRNIIGIVFISTTKDVLLILNYTRGIKNLPIAAAKGSQ